MNSYTKPPLWLSLSDEVAAERLKAVAEEMSFTRAGMNHCEDDLEEKALRAGFSAGVWFAMERIARSIRAELVCRPSDTVDRIQAWAEESDSRQLTEHPEYHAICYWGEMAARLAEDPHSMLESPYECPGSHPGECWNSRIDFDLEEEDGDA